MGLLDLPVFALDHPDGKALRDGLARHFQGAERIRTLCREAGLAVERLSFTGAPVAVWDRVLDYAATTRELRRLVAIVAVDPESVWIRELLQRLLSQPEEDEKGLTAERSGPTTPAAVLGEPGVPGQPTGVGRLELALVNQLRWHRGWVSALAFSPDGSLLASAGEDGRLLLWDLTTDAGPQSLIGHVGPVHSVTFNDAGSLLASSGTDRTIRLWDVPTFRPVRLLIGHSDAVLSVAFGKGMTLASGGADHMVCLWDIRTDKPYFLHGHDDAVSRVAFSRNRALLASAGADRTVRLWAMPGGEHRHVLNGHSAKISGISFSSDGTLASTDWNEQSVRLWNSVSGQSVGILAYDGERLLDVAFSPNGALLAASGSSDGSVRVRVTMTGAWLTPQNGHEGPATCLAFSHDGTLLASGGADHAVHLWQCGNPTGGTTHAPVS